MRAGFVALFADRSTRCWHRVVSTRQTGVVLILEDARDQHQPDSSRSMATLATTCRLLRARKVSKRASVLKQHWLTSAVFLLLAPTAWWVLRSTGFGLRVHAVCENFEAADVVGIHINRTRYLALGVGSRPKGATQSPRAQWAISLSAAGSAVPFSATVYPSTAGTSATWVPGVPPARIVTRPAAAAGVEPSTGPYKYATRSKSESKVGMRANGRTAQRYSDDIAARRDQKSVVPLGSSDPNRSTTVAALAKPLSAPSCALRVRVGRLSGRCRPRGRTGIGKIRGNHQSEIRQ